MTAQSKEPVLLMIRGTLAVKDPDAARKLHNETAGSDAGVAAAQGLGDLSHKVYVPAVGAEKTSDGKTGELLIMDVWQTPEAIGQFFADPNVVKTAGQLFSTRDPVVYMPAKDAFTFHLPAPMSRTDRYIGILRATMKSAQQTIDAFGEQLMKAQRANRKRGQLSHQLYFRLGPPSADGSVEMVGVDVFCDLKGMLEAYSAEAMGAMAPLFAGKPSGSIWQQPQGAWVEW